jgi:hypothetical protein
MPAHRKHRVKIAVAIEIAKRDSGSAFNPDT